MKKVFPYLLALVLAAGAYYFGTLQNDTGSQATAPADGTFPGQDRLTNLSDEERQQLFEDRGLGNRTPDMGGTGNPGGGISGTVLSIDDDSMTIQLDEGGSQIVYITGSTTVDLVSDGSLSDITTGTTVSVRGVPSSDNITADTIQVETTP